VTDAAVYANFLVSRSAYADTESRVASLFVSFHWLIPLQIPPIRAGTAARLLLLRPPQVRSVILACIGEYAIDEAVYPPIIAWLADRASLPRRW
jgi:hypothetical protein